MPLDNRCQLGFVDAVRSQIEPLLTRYGFVRIEENTHVVRFESPNVSLSFFHQPVSYELDVVAARKDRPDQHFSLQDLVEAEGGNKPTFFQASSSDRGFLCVASITQLLEKYGDKMMRGDAGAFIRMADVLERRSRAYTIEVVDKPVREAADSAWKKKDYDEVKRLYEAITGELTEVERKKLDHATNHLCND